MKEQKPKNRPWNNADILYINKDIWKNIPSKPVIKRCNYCKCIIVETQSGNKYSLYIQGYCSYWCREIDNPPEIKHICIECGIAVMPFKRKSGQSTGVFSKRCEKHRRHYIKRE